MTPEPGKVTYRLGDFLFETATGEVRPARDSSGTGAVRLAPQPAKLLELLIEKNGELASREEIYEELWPDTHVDFEQGLRFCVSQLRSALGDSAREPTYVETLPRRGYRLIRPVEAVRTELPAGGDVPADPPRPAARGRRGAWRPAAVAGLLITVLAVGAGLGRGCRPLGRSAAVRLAIMPFELAAEGGDSTDLARLSEWLTVELTGGWGDRLEVIGPRSTAAYSSFPFPDLGQLADDLAVDFVLNARFLERDGESHLVVELIRLGDGAHPWAELFADPHSWEAIARQVRDGVASALGLPPATPASDRE